MSKSSLAVSVRVATLSCAALLLLALTTSADLKNTQVVHQAGKWKILRDLDPMTDKVVCTAIFGDNDSIQLAADTLYIGVRGGARSLILRFDEKAPHPMRLATEIEKNVDAYIIDGNDFAELVASHRLRYQALTLVAGIVNGDLDLTGIGEALASIRGGCSLGKPPQSPAPAAKPEADRINGQCTAVMQSKMKESGLGDAQIAAICKPAATPAAPTSPLPTSAGATGLPAPVPEEPTALAPTEAPGFRRIALVGTSVLYPYTVAIPADWQVHNGKPPQSTLFLAPPAVLDADLYPDAIGVVAGTASLTDPELVAANIQRNLKGVKTVTVKQIDGIRGILAEFDQGDGATASTVLALMLPTPTGSVQLLGRSPRAQFAAHRMQYERILFSVRRAP